MIWVIDRFDGSTGATVAVPGSHLGESERRRDLAEPILAEPGSVVLLDGRLWHGTGRNEKQSEPRRAIFSYYCRPYLRQQENFPRSLNFDVRRGLAAEQRQLLGFDIWLGLGSVDGLPIDWMNGRERIGPSKPDVFEGREEPGGSKP